MLRRHAVGSPLAVALAVVTLVSIGHAPPAHAQQVQPSPAPSAPQPGHQGYSYGAGAPDVAPTQATAAAANGDVHLDELMTLREWDASGVARLRPDERTALEVWVQRYRRLLLDSASSPRRTAAVKSEASGEIAAAPSNPATAAPSAPVNMAPLAPAAPPANNQPGVTYQAPNAQPAYGYAAPGGSAPQPTGPASAPQYPPPGNTVTTPGNTGSAPATQAPAYSPAPAQQPAYSAPPPPVAPSGSVATPVVPYPTAPTTPAQAPPSQPLAPSYPGPSYSITAAPSGGVAPTGAVVRTGLSVRSVLVGNRFVSLTDGSMWDVYPADRPEAGVWHSSDPVYVRVATGNVNGGYDRELVNASRNVLVRARFAGEVSTGGTGR